MYNELERRGNDITWRDVDNMMIYPEYKTKGDYNPESQEASETEAEEDDEIPPKKRSKRLTPSKGKDILDDEIDLIQL